MDDQQPKKKPLSEIGHLFLSDVRDRHLGGMPRPQRTPPGGKAPPQGPPASPIPAPAPRSDVSIDLTPEEYAEVFGGGAAGASAAAGAAGLSPRRTPPITAILGEHLNGKQFARVKEYARHLAAREGRIGLIQLDGSEFRLMCFEPGAAADCPTVSPAAEVPTEAYDPRAMAEAVEEMNFDVDRWLLLVPSPRVLEAQPLLALVDHWALLTTCDHDGVVSSYRMLKGMADLARPRLTLAVLDAHDEAQAARVHNKLAGVCEQFLGRTLEAEAPIRRAYRVAEHLVMLCRPTRDKAQLGNPPQWGLVEEFLGKAKVASAGVVDSAEATPTADSTMTAEVTTAAEAAVPGSTHDASGEGVVTEPAEPATRELVGDVVVATAAAPATDAAPSGPTPAVFEHRNASAAPAPQAPLALEGGAADVLDLPNLDATAEQIVNAVLKQDGGSSLLECPVRAPMCADARLAVTREHGVVLVAVAGRGLTELRSIGQAYRWLVENRSLIGMAVPQLAIDATQTPHLRLLVDRRDANADVLQPMLGGDHVTVQSYRRLKWGHKAGLLLEAA